MDIRGFITHKLSESYEDCQDFFDVEPRTKRIAVSDGMSQSIFPSKWAEILVRHYITPDSKTKEFPKDDLPLMQQEWQDFAKSKLYELQTQGKSNWMLENCLAERQGAGATFAGLQFIGEYDWYAEVLGDSCIIEVSEANEIIRICTSQEGEFDNHPDYFDSFRNGKGELKSFDGTLKEGYKLLLVSDPISDFLSVKWKEKKEASYIEQLLRVKNPNDFERLVDDWRSREKMHNDDTTLVIVEYNGEATFEDDPEGKIFSLPNTEMYFNNMQKVVIEAESNVDQLENSNNTL